MCMHTVACIIVTNVNPFGKVSMNENPKENITVVVFVVFDSIRMERTIETSMECHRGAGTPNAHPVIHPGWNL